MFPIGVYQTKWKLFTLTFVSTKSQNTGLEMAARQRQTIRYCPIYQDIWKRDALRAGASCNAVDIKKQDLLNAQCAISLVTMVKKEI